MKRAFEHCADDYARYRPGYPAAALDALTGWFGAPGGRWAADVGAGTGILSRQLAAAGWRVIAVEPSPAMLRHGPRDDRLPVVRLAAAAEATAVKTASVDLVTAGQAAHWFNPRDAFPELGRILAPGGGLALLWNNREPALDPFVEQYETLIQRYNPAYRRDYRKQDWAAKLDETGLFTPVRPEQLDWIWTVPPDHFVGFGRSVSYIRNVLSRTEFPRFEADLRRLIESRFGGGPCRIPMRVEMWLTTRR